MSSRLKIREAVKKLNPIDDLMFRKMAESKEFCQEILRVFLENEELIVIEATPQWTGTNLQGRSVILDAKCERKDGSIVNIEVQKSDDDDHQRRVRYNGAILTTNITEPGEKFRNIPDVCIVFISNFDIFEAGFSVYHIDRVVREIGKPVKNGFEEIYINAKANDGSKISELMKVFSEDEAYNEEFPKTSEIKRLFKESEGGLDSMSDIVERLKMEARIEGKLEGRVEGKIEGKIETALNLKDMGFNLEQIVRAVNVEESTVREWLREDRLKIQN